MASMARGPSMSNLIQRDCGNFHDPAPMVECWIVPSSVAWLVPVWPWKARKCSGCGEVVADWGWFGTLAFETLVGWWWDGGVVVREQVPAVDTRTPHL